MFIPKKRILASWLFCALVCVPVADAASATDFIATQAPSHDKCLVYVGTFTGPNSKGIYGYRFDQENGKLTPLGAVGESPNPAFLDVDSPHDFLFAINEINRFEGKATGAATAFAINPATGILTSLNQRSTVGRGPCHVLLDAAGKNILVANYASGSITVLPVAPDGHLDEPTAFIQHAGKSINPARQEGPHAHCATLDAANRFAFVCDLGLDKVLIYKFDFQRGTLTPNDPPFAAIKPGSGPRHLAFHPNGRQAYVINELNSTITRFAYETNRGVLTEKQTISTLPADFQGKNFPAEIVVHPSGAFLYGSNRGHDSIAIFAIDSTTGALKNAGFESTRGKNPRNFAIDPTGTFLLAANQDTGNLAVFKIDPRTGRLSFTGQMVDVPAPACVTFYRGH